MSPAETVTTLRQLMDWRHDKSNWPPSPMQIEKAIAAAIEMIERLESAEKDVALKERVIDALGSELNAVANERDALRAKIEQMERQEPVAWLHETRRDSDVVTDAVKHVWGKAAVGSMAAYSIPLYALPGAQPAPSVPMDVIADYLVSISAHLARRDDAKAQAEIGELLKMITSAPKPGASVPEDVMRDAERYRYLRARDDGTAGVGCWIEADGRVCDRGWLYGVQLDSAIDSFIEVLAAAPKPEAKP